MRIAFVSMLNATYLDEQEIENTSWKVLAYGIYARVVDVSEIERVSAANEFFLLYFGGPRGAVRCPKAMKTKGTKRSDKNKNKKLG